MILVCRGVLMLCAITGVEPLFVVAKAIEMILTSRLHVVLKVRDRRYADVGVFRQMEAIEESYTVRILDDTFESN